MGTPTTVCVNDDLTTGQAGVTLLTTVHSATDNIKINVKTQKWSSHYTVFIQLKQLHRFHDFWKFSDFSWIIPILQQKRVTTLKIPAFYP